MRCGCPQCGTFMIHEEGGGHLDCCCPACGYRCSACLGTDSVMSREDIGAFREGKFVSRMAEIEQQLAREEEDETELSQERECLWPWNTRAD